MTIFPAGRAGRGFRLSHLLWYLVVLVAAVLLALLQPAAWAQEPALQDAPPDPPGRVARLNVIEGAVSFAPADDTAWTPAELNRPLTSGDRLWTGPSARSELHVGSTALRMSEQTSLDFLVLDDSVAQLRLAQGTLQLRVRTLFEGQRLELDTPNLAFVISEPGNYRLDVNLASDTTRVVVQSGGGVIYGNSGETVNLGGQQQASYSGTGLTAAAPGDSWLDAFDSWAADRDRREDQSLSAQYIPREIVGYQQLDSYGDWYQDPGYGAVWLPRAVPVNWAPYRVGHWRWIGPWGWTWIDDAPWGFAPFHYGRWAQIGPRWAWVPGRLAARPVYAPALVAFVGGSGGANWSLTIGSANLAQPAVGWFPLAPGEAFRPHYRVSPRYISQMNQNIVVNGAVNASNRYRHQRQSAAVTAVSRDDFARGRPVRGNLHPLSAQDLSRAQVAAERSALPQRQARADARDRPNPAPAAALPPAAMMARPVVGGHEGSRGEPRAGRPDNRGRGAIDAEQRVRRTQQQLQHDQARQQRAQPDPQRPARELRPQQHPEQRGRQDQEMHGRRRADAANAPGAVPATELRRNREP